jgi:prepilin-type N-terminal cleavage/methylation domain-containing protein
MRRSNKGFSLVELMVVLAIIGTLVRIALPNYRAMVTNARAAHSVEELLVVRTAAFGYFAQTGSWPAESPAGTMPAELTPFLSKGLNFKPNGYELDWDNWILPSGLPGHPGANVFMGISVSTTDELLGLTVVALLKKSGAAYSSGTSYTLPIVGTNETL